MKDVDKFSRRRNRSLMDRSVVSSDESGSPLKMRFRDSVAEKISPFSIVAKTEDVSNETQKKVRKILPFRSSNCEALPLRESRKIIQLSPAQMNVGRISEKAYNRRHGLQESGMYRFFRRKIKEPVERGLMKVGDFFVKAYGQSYLDRFDMLRFKFSDKNNNYSRGIIPKFLRMPLSLFGTPAMGNIPSLLFGKTSPGRNITHYREGRRSRVDTTKYWMAKPFRRFTTNVSSKLPFHKQRYKMVQKMRGINEWIKKGEDWAKSLINGGMSGVQARGRQKKAFREREARLKEISNIPKGKSSAVKKPFLLKKNGGIPRAELPKKRTLEENSEGEETQFPIAA